MAGRKRNLGAEMKAHLIAVCMDPSHPDRPALAKSGAEILPHLPAIAAACNAVAEAEAMAAERLAALEKTMSLKDALSNPALLTLWIKDDEQRQEQKSRSSHGGRSGRNATATADIRAHRDEWLRNNNGKVMGWMNEALGKFDLTERAIRARLKE